VVVDEPPPGYFTEQNQSLERGAQVAVAELNGAGGLAGHTHVQLIEQSLDGLTPAAIRSKLEAEGAAVLVLPCDTTSQENLVAAGNAFHMLMVAPCNPETEAGARYATYWPVGMSGAQEATGLASYIRSQGYHHVFVVNATGSRFIQLATSNFRAAAPSHGIQVVGATTVPLGTSDYSGVAQSIRAASTAPSAIYTALPPPQVNQLAAALHALGLHETIFGSSDMDTRLALVGGARELESAAFTAYGFPRQSASAQHFEADYRARFRRAPVGSYSGLGLEAIRLIKAAAAKAHSPQPQSLQRALSSGVTLRGVALADRAYRGGNHDPGGQVAITGITTGQFVPLLSSEPS
jgi:ABC-type branched-subunit amino acid transport system substrate-binding protein